MKKPTKLLIQGHTYKIISNNSEECKNELLTGELRGCIKYPVQKIYIAPDQDDEGWFLTLIHECMHGFIQHMGCKDNEKLTDNLAAAIFTFLQENKLWKIQK